MTYKKKNRLLLLSSVVGLFLIYSLSISKTVQAYSDYGRSTDRMEMAQNAPEQALKLERDLQGMDARIGKKETGDQDVNQSLLELITNYCQDNQAILREFPEGMTSTNGDLLIDTSPIVVEGAFSSLLKLVYVLEQKVDLGKIACVRYALAKDKKSKEMILTATIYIQNIKKKKENDITEK